MFATDGTQFTGVNLGSATPAAPVAYANTAANILALTPTDLANLKASGFTGLWIADTVADVVILTSQQWATLAADETAMGGTGLVFADSGADILSMTSQQAALLGANGVNSIVVNDGGIDLPIQLALSFAANGQVLSSADGGAIIVADLAGNLELLTPSEIAQLQAVGVVGLAATDASLQFDATLMVAILSSGFTVTEPAGDVLTVRDSAAAIAARFDALDSDVANIRSISFTDTGAPNLILTQTQVINDAALLAKIVGLYNLVVTEPGIYFATGFSAAQVSLKVNPDGSVTLTTPEGDETLTGVTTVELSDATITIFGDTLTQINADGSEVVSQFNITGQFFTSTVLSYDVSGDLLSAVYNGVTGQAYDSFEKVFSGVSSGGADNVIGAKFFYTGQTSGLNEIDYDGGGHVTMVDYGPTNGAAWSNLELDYVAGQFADSAFTFAGPGGSSSYSAVTLEFNYANQFANSQYSFEPSGQAYGLEQVTVNVADALTEIRYSDYSGAAGGASEVDVFYGAGDAVTGLTFDYAVTGQAYDLVKYSFNAALQLTSVEYDNFTGTPYSSIDQLFSNGVLQNVVLGFSNVNDSPAYAESVIESASGAVEATVYRLINGGDALNGSASNFAFPTLGGTDAALASSDNAYAFSGGDWTIAGGGKGDTFTFAPLFNSAEITDYGAAFTSGTPDIVSVSTQDFANWQTMLGDAAASGPGGANTTFASTATGDRLTLDGVTVAQLTALTPSQVNADFPFHP